jgi:hypothetical protein
MNQDHSYLGFLTKILAWVQVLGLIMSNQVMAVNWDRKQVGWIKIVAGKLSFTQD